MSKIWQWLPAGYGRRLCPMNLPIAEMPLPIRFRPPTPMTDDELLVFCERNDVLWIEREANGDIHIKPIPGCLVSATTLDILVHLSRWSDTDGRGEVFSNIGFSLPDGSMLGAYIACLHKDKVNRFTEEERRGFPRRSPDFVVEIVGPFDEPRERQEKVQKWLANGVELVWLIDPEEKSVTIYRPADEPEHLAHPTSIQGTGPIAGFELVMSRIWD
jgi:Uma2 family endonuclease